MHLCRSTVGLWLLLAPLAAWSCNDPTKHPEWWMFRSMVNALGEQEPIPVQMMYKIGDDRSPGENTEVMLLFSSLGEYESAQYTVVPSNGLGLIDFSGEGEIQTGRVDFAIKPLNAGFHHLRVTLTVTENGNTSRNIFLLPVPVQLEHSALRLGFNSGNRLLRNQPLENQLQQRLGGIQMPGHKPQ